MHPILKFLIKSSHTNNVVYNIILNKGIFYFRLAQVRQQAATNGSLGVNPKPYLPNSKPYWPNSALGARSAELRVRRSYVTRTLGVNPKPYLPDFKP